MKKRLVADLVVIGVTVGIVWLIQHPEDVRYVRPWLLRSGAHTCRHVAEKAWRMGLKLESRYAEVVRP
jgi:hypothetical protein